MAKRLTQEEFVQKVNEKYNGKFEVVGEYVNAKTPIKIKHKSCGTIFLREPNKITAKGRNTCCPTCEGYKARFPLIGINDLWTTHPDIAELLKNPEDGYKCSKGTNDEMIFLCNHCKHDINKPVYEVVSRGYLPCPFCSSGKSYPNRFMANLLHELNVNFISEYIIEPYSYRFDFYFLIEEQKYIVEMDGELGHGNKTWGGGKDFKGLITDTIKDDICRENNIEVIRIDCNYTNNRFEYIKKSVLNSKLDLLFDFSAINFNNIDRASCSSLVIDLSNYWNNGIRSYEQLMELTYLSHDTVRTYLKIACEKNYILDSYNNVLKEIRLASNKKITNSKSYRIMCNQTKQIFGSIKEAYRITGISTIRLHLAGELSYAGKLPDGTKLTWTKITNEEYEQMLSEEHRNRCSFLM